jgi:hypothetical protein
MTQECLDLKKLMARSIELTEGLVHHKSNLEESLQDPDALVPLRNDFCNTFGLMSVLPFHCEAHHPARDPGHRVTLQVQTGLQVGHSHEPDHLRAELEGMKQV